MDIQTAVEACCVKFGRPVGSAEQQLVREDRSSVSDYRQQLGLLVEVIPPSPHLILVPLLTDLCQSSSTHPFSFCCR